jgi:hypothetical protein
MLPKKVIKKIPLTSEKVGYPRREQLLADINKDGTYLPKSLLHEDLDGGFLEFVKNDLRTSVSGKDIRVVDILMTTQNWSQFTQTWDFNNIDKNIQPPFITTIRTPEVKFGTIPSLKYNIPNRKQYYYAAVPTWDGQRKGMDIYTIPQPVPVDIKYSVKIICNRMRELNKFNQVIIEKFSSRQAYAQIKGHYIPIQLDEVSDESVMDLEKRRYYIQTYSFTLQGFLIDENEFEVKPAVSRSLLLMEVNPTKTKRRVKKNPPNPDIVPLNISFPIGVTSYTQTFEYTTNIKLIDDDNISSYSMYINGLFYGTDIPQLLTGEIQINTNDVLNIQIVKTNNSQSANFQLESTLI